MKNMTMTPDSAQNRLSDSKEIDLFGAHCLNYLISDPDELANFMNISGYGPQTLRDSIDTVELQAALLNYFASNEAALLAMCANAGIKTSRFMGCWGRQNAHI